MHICFIRLEKHYSYVMGKEGVFMQKSLLCRTINCENWRIEYYLTIDFSIEKHFGIHIIMYDITYTPAVISESSMTEGVFYSMEEAYKFIELLADESVMPSSLHDIIEDYMYI